MEYEDLIEEDEHEELGHLRTRRRKLYVTALNSTIIYLICYLIAYLLFYIITINVADNFGIRAKLFYWKIGWLAGPDSPNWYQRSIKNIFSSGPYSCFAFALIVAAIYIIRQNKKGLFPLFCIWLFLHFINMFLGSVIIGLLTTINYPYTSQILKTISDFMFFTKDASYSSQGFGYVADWLYFSNKQKIFFFAGSFIVSMAIGFFSARFFLKSSHSVSLIKTKQSRQVLIMFQTFIPWLFGSLFLLMLKFPHDTRYEIYFYLTMLVMISPALLNVLRDPESFRQLIIIKQPKSIEIHKTFLFGMLICYLVFRVVFSFGIYVTI